MKILFLASTFRKQNPSWHLMKMLMEAVLDRGHKIHAIQRMYKNNDLPAFPESIINHKNFTYAEVLRNTVDKNKFISRYLDGIMYSWDLRKYIKKNNDYYAIFLQPSFNAVFILTLARHYAKKRPIIYNVQDIFPENIKFSGQLPFSKLTYPAFRFLQKKAYKKADKIITISEDMKDTLVKSGVKEEKIEVIYNWSYSDEKITLENISPENVFDLNTDKDKLNVVYAGNIGKMQNVEIIVEAAKLSVNDAIHYYIIGGGANRNRISNLVNGMSNVTLLPMQPSNFAESIYAQADVNLIPLAKGGIKTALPSKTATVLRTDSFAVFCIDKDSKFENTVKISDNVRVAYNDDANSLYQVVKELASRKLNKTDDNDKLMELFSVRNAYKYVDVFEKAVGVMRAE